MSRTKTVDPRKKRKTKKKVRFTLANTPTQDRVKRIQKKKKMKFTQDTNWKRASRQFSKSWVSMGSKAISSVIGKKLIDKGIENIPNIFKHGLSKIKNKNVQRALNSDIADYAISKETQNQAKNKLDNLFSCV